MRIGTAVAARTGIFYGWWVVFAAGTITFLTGGTFVYGFSALFNPVIEEFGWSRASLSFAFSLRSEVGGIASPVVGFLADRVGPRRLMMAGVLIIVIGFVFLSQAQSLLTFYAAVVVIAVGMSCAAGPIGMVAVTHWFRRRRGQALSLLAAAVGMSGVMVVILTGLISAFGWRDALLIMAAVQLIIGFPMAMSIRNRPEELGLRPDGDIVETIPGDVLDPQPWTREMEEGATVREAIRHPSFWKLSLSVTLVNLGMLAVIVHQIPFLTSSVGLSDGLAGATVTVMLALSLIGRFGLGSMSDRFDPKYVMGTAAFLSGVSLLMFASLYEGWQLIYALPVFAIGWGGMIPTRPTLQAHYFGLRAFGAIQGLVFTVATFGALIGPVFAGWMYDETESYRLAFIILAACALAAVPLVLSIRSIETE